MKNQMNQGERKMRNVIMIVCFVSMMGCNGGGATSAISVARAPSAAESNPAATDSVHKKYLLQNVVFKKSGNSSSRVEKLDTTTQISIDDIVLGDAEVIGRLKSTNLKDALSNEIAADLATVLKSTKWKVEYKINSAHLHNDHPNILTLSFSGDEDTVDNSHLTFNADGTVTVDKCFLVAGNRACWEAVRGYYAGPPMVSAPTYEIINNSAILVTYKTTDPLYCSGYTWPTVCQWDKIKTYRTIIQVAEVTATKIVLINKSTDDMPTFPLGVKEEIAVLTPATE